MTARIPASIHTVSNSILRKILANLAELSGAYETLGLVCHRWNDLVKEISEFRSVIHLKENIYELRDHPKLWQEKATFQSHPLTVIWDLDWDTRCTNEDAEYSMCFQNLLEAAPYTRWKGLHVVQMSPSPPGLAEASFENLEIL